MLKARGTILFDTFSLMRVYKGVKSKQGIKGTPLRSKRNKNIKFLK
jgi:hypothetical protein